MTNTYTPIASVTLSATASEVVFSGLPQTFRDLIVVVSGTTSRSAFNIDGMVIRFNGDTSNYSLVRMIGSNSGATSDTDSKIGAGFSGNSAGPAVAILQVMDYAQTNKHKTVLIRYNTDASYVSGMVTGGAGRWASTAAVTTITLLPEVGPNFNIGSTFTIYGVIA